MKWDLVFGCVYDEEVRVKVFVFDVGCDLVCEVFEVIEWDDEIFGE